MVKLPDLSVLMLTVPVGVTFVPDPVSVTVTVQAVPIPTSMLAGEQPTEVDVGLPFTVKVVPP